MPINEPLLGGAGEMLTYVAAVLFATLVPMLLGSVLRVMCTYLIHLKSIPQPALAGWLTGHLKPLARNDYYHQVLAWANEFGPVFRFRIFFRTTIVVSDPALVQQVRSYFCARLR